MKFVTARTAYNKIVCPSDDELTIYMPGVPRTGGLDIELHGMPVYLRPADAASRALGGWRVIASGEGPRFDVDGFAEDVSDREPRDIFGIAGTIKNVVVNHCRLGGVQGMQETPEVIHPDAIQIRNGAVVDTLFLRNSTIISGGQGIMSYYREDGGGLRRIILENVNFRDRPATEPGGRTCQTVAVLLQGNAVRQGVIDLRGEVWFDWPGGQTYCLATGGNVDRLGTENLRFGPRPAGDFCPA